MCDKIKLKGSDFCHINFSINDNDFTFIVNGTSYETSKFFADYLSPAIAQLHSSEPTLNSFLINTSVHRDFHAILNLANFTEYEVPQNDRIFFAEIFEIIGTESIELRTEEEEAISLGNVFNRIQLHEKYENYYNQILQEEIDFVSMHFYEINQNQEELLGGLNERTIEQIIQNSKLQLQTNDQLIKIVNHIYRIDSKFSKLYEFVDFTDASNETINDFINNFDLNDLTAGTYEAILKRFKCIIINNYEQNVNANRPHPKKFNKFIQYQNKNDFKGIINYIKTHINGDIFDYIIVEASSMYSEAYSPKNVILYDDLNKDYWSQNAAYSYLIFDFKNHKIKPTFYTIRSDRNIGYFLRSWNIQGSNDKNRWDNIDTINECYQLNGHNQVYTFPIQNQIETEYRYIRLYQTNVSWNNQWFLSLNAIEFYGSIH